MAILNGMYIHVVDEKVDKGVEAPTHPVEEGIGTTDMVRMNPITISLSGKIVDYSAMKSHEVLAKISSLMASGSLVSYRGRNVKSNLIIRAFSTSHPNTNSGGADFEMELQEIRTAKSAYVEKTATATATSSAATTRATTNAGTQQVKSGSGTAVYHTVKSGDTVWALVNKSYKHLGKTVQWVMDNNPAAFTRKGDASTLKVGARLLMGYK